MTYIVLWTAVWYGIPFNLRHVTEDFDEAQEVATLHKGAKIHKLGGQLKWIRQTGGSQYSK